MDTKILFLIYGLLQNIFSIRNYRMYCCQWQLPNNLLNGHNFYLCKGQLLFAIILLNQQWNFCLGQKEKPLPFKFIDMCTSDSTKQIERLKIPKPSCYRNPWWENALMFVFPTFSWSKCQLKSSQGMKQLWKKIIPPKFLPNDNCALLQN